jgi:L-amino acid N-acyltransferase YncA
MSEPTVRRAVVDDLGAVADIYAHHVRTGVATIPPDAREGRRRFDAVLDSGLPFLAAERNGDIVGYAY